MRPDGTRFQSPILIRVLRGYGLLVTLLLLITLTGYLTSHAAGPPEREPAASLPPATPTPTLVLATPTPAITLIPNLAVRAFQTSTATATITATATATATMTPSPVPTTDTPTLEPTDTPTPEPTDTPQPTNTPWPTDTPPPAIRPTVAPFLAYAWVDNYYPEPGSTVTVYGRLYKNGRPVNGAHMGVTWRYTHGEGYCSAYTGIDGQAACSQNIGVPLANYWVYLDVVFIVHEDEVYYARTGFVTDP
jgi:hypothetical protein